MDEKTYYLGYEDRYQRVFAAGGDCWGHAPTDEGLVQILTEWVEAQGLRGKRVVEFACGEGASGVILSRLGCVYHGVDVAPTAVAKAREALEGFPQARVSRLDMVTEEVPDGPYDAALDVMGFHMLVTDGDRLAYLRHALAALHPGAPMLFYRECYRHDIFDGPVPSLDAFLARFGGDYVTLGKRQALRGTDTVEVEMPLLPARAHTEAGYRQEMHAAGFTVDAFRVETDNVQCPSSASLWVRRPAD